MGVKIASPIGSAEIVHNIVAATPADPAGSSSATFVMAGLAIPLTPRQTGNLKINITGNVSNDTPTDGAQVQGAYGTGAAPVNGAAATGTTFGNVPGTLISTAANQLKEIAIVARVIGLTLNTAYWIDLQFKAVTGGIVTLSNLSYIIEEW